ncbi:MAG: DUF1559 domain-containing protein [Planctomycetes bacterium]|nr:DUF1559 domain-containing protein [Planctomycetota bacterium]MBL7038969.1 DUF1559 domain-containing protein [Pirellulaceae bacterium]
MNIPFTCPHCGTQTDVYEEYAGQTGPCAVCGRMVTVPYPSTADVQPALPSETATPPVDASGRPKSSVMILITVIIAAILGVGIVVGLLIALVFPAVSVARSEANKTQSSKNMEVIAAAMLSYEADHGSFPPAYIADEDGKPMHSWRVLLLPYLGPGYDHVYEQYNFKEPWDGPNNMNLRYSMPPEYACPADPDASSNYETSYMVIVGDQTMFPGAASVTRSELTDGAAYTIMLAQSPASGVCWMEPKDLDADGMRFEINGREGVEIASRHPGGAHVVTADGESHFLTDDAAPDTVEALTTVSGNEDIPWYAFE